MRIDIKIFVIALIAVLFACDDDVYNYTLGDDFVDDDSRMVMIDSMNLNTYTIKADSIETSRVDHLLVGKATDNYGIENYCEGYFRVQPSSYPTFDENAETKYDSIVMVLNFNKYTFGDVTKTNHLGIYRLTEEIELDETSSRVHNHQFDSETTPLGTCSFSEYELDHDSLQIRLDDDFGKELFSLIVDKDEQVTTRSEFIEYLKGFVLKPTNADDGFVAGFSASQDSANSPKIYLYYSDQSMNDTKKITFPIYDYNESDATNEYLCNYIESDLTGTPFEELKDGEDRVSSKGTNDMTLVYGGHAMGTRIEIPGIKNLRYLGLGAVVKAELIFEPVKGYFNDDFPLPKYLHMQIIDEDNDYLTQLTDLSGEEAAVGYLVSDEEFDEYYYTFPITEYVKTIYHSLADETPALHLTLLNSQVNTTLNRLVLGSQDNRDYEMRLKVYMTLFDE